ncbi:hypothetical protein PoB_005157600 [Plakobranchus ocellatus]|uniref:CUB domain-containing protein n=1 Tax=Plakobranchus ocellatus TaxID=259542 RepID=A0AAV4BX26_9GAST|nr:hypothetical protein PoB_005157600 [Plakobranchus ocellatus]
MLSSSGIPTEPSCASPEFVDEGTAVLFSCTADRIFPRGRCEFTLMDGKNISEQRLQQTTSHDMSFRFPGEQKVTCQLHLSVTDVPGGSYRFQVEVSPDLPRVQASDIIVTSPLPTLSLRSTALYKPSDNDHVFKYDGSGQFSVDVEIVGNPGPNRVSLRLKSDEISNGNPVLSQNYHWRYERSAGNDGGIIQIFITGGLPTSGTNMYSLKAENGVAGGDTFVYVFSVIGSDQDEATKGLKTVEIIGIVAAGSVVVVVIVIVLVVILILRRRHRPQQPSQKEDYDVPERNTVSDSDDVDDEEEEGDGGGGRGG